jgi:hypothetical protein
MRTCTRTDAPGLAIGIAGLLVRNGRTLPASTPLAAGIGQWTTVTGHFA